MERLRVIKNECILVGERAILVGESGRQARRPHSRTWQKRNGTLVLPAVHAVRVLDGSYYGGWTSNRHARPLGHARGARGNGGYSGGLAH
eukprot:scaffold46753_cov258-Isochrysis_galbana.AAC.3